MGKCWTLDEKIAAMRKNLKIAKANADDNGWLRSENWHIARRAEIERAKRKLDKLLAIRAQESSNV